ncbi:MAG: hypothetical protein KAS32_05570 [Candidatus Peribacteraceae bacterium]|nr:hypothetical protein [Candidatus Peribacteraceae bacterium]
MKVAIAIDAWKLPVFEQGLDDAGYAFTSEYGSQELIILKVVTHNPVMLGAVVRQMNEKATKEKQNSGKYMH